MPDLLRRAKLLLAGFFIALSAAAPAGAVISFTAKDGILFSSMTPQAVVPYASGYRMYLSSGGFRVLSATSTDLVSWGLEGGVRLSTGVAAALDASSITSCGVYFSTNPADALRMYYTAISTSGRYSVLSATSTDGLSWGKESGVRLRSNGGSGYIDSVRPFPVSASLMRLFYIADNSGGDASSNYRVFSASSADGGVNFGGDAAVLSSEQAFQVSVTSLADARVRVYYTQPLTAQTTVTQVLSAIAADIAAFSFSKESGVRLSTASTAAGLTHPVVVRATDSYQWRMFHALHPSSSTGPFVAGALANTPLVLTMDPAKILNSGTAISFTLAGEIFASPPAVTFTIGGDTITPTGVAAATELKLTGTLNPLGRTTGNWHAVVTNPDGGVGTLAPAFVMDIPPGETTIVDNLLRPRQGGATTLGIKTFGSGRITVNLYTTGGALLRTLMDQDQPAGSYSVAWDGTTSLGGTVASGVYLLHIRGPRIDKLEKIVVIK